ncbi:hypothetical protein HDV00_003644 [Rhizophlyctis rosea]|nr:hypothetical protein HDV00_003644 [Rhizophlyctis rosea]
MLVAYVGGIILLEILCLLVLQFRLDNPTYSQSIQIPLTETFVEQNACPKSNSIGVGLLYTWNGIIILLAAIYAFRTKNVQSDYNENKFTGGAILLISVISLIIVPVLSIISNPTAIFLMVSLGTILGTILSTSIFAIPKIAIAYELVAVQETSSRLGNMSSINSAMFRARSKENINASGMSKDKSGTVIMKASLSTLMKEGGKAVGDGSREILGTGDVLAAKEEA